LEFVWAQDSNEYAIRESTSKIKLFRSFKEKTNVSLRVPFSAEGIFGGNLLAVKSSTFVIFYDWETGAIVRRVDVAVLNVYWSETDCVCISSPDNFYVLKFNRAALQNHLERGTPVGDEGYEDVLDFIEEVSETYVIQF
jgi:coatomer subunit beta'